MERIFARKYIELHINNNFLPGLLAGAAVGIIVGILFAPDKGSETRRKIREKESR
jgi:gas vesicle protein